MGRAKERMMDIQEGNLCIARWKCPNCKTDNETDYEPPSISFGGEAREMSNSDTLTLYCDNCSAEYEGTIWNELGHISFMFDEDNGVEFEIEADDIHQLYHDYDFWEPSDSPDDEFYVTMEGMRHLMASQSPSEYDDQLLNRVIFTQIITAIETYLSDTLLNVVDDDVEAQQKIYATDKKMQKVVFKASKLLTDAQLPKKHLMVYLQSVSFHEFPMIDNLYQISLSTSIFANDEDRRLMNKARILRHHCVHRNGKDTKGTKLRNFNNEYIKSIADAADRMIFHIRSALTSRDFEAIDNLDI